MKINFSLIFHLDKNSKSNFEGLVCLKFKNLQSQHFARLRHADQITRSGDGDHSGQYGETLSLLKTCSAGRAWWLTSVIPALWEAEVGGS